MQFADGFEPVGQGQGPARGGAPNTGPGAPPAQQQPVAPVFDGSPQATAALHPGVRDEVDRLNAARGVQGGFQAAQQSIKALGGINHPDATNVLAYLASNRTATAGLGNEQQLRSDALTQLGNRPGALGPREIRALADTLGNASPMVGGKASNLLGQVGFNGSPEQQDRVQAELKRIADTGAPTERMQANDPRREINMDGKAAARATDVLARMGPPNGAWDAGDYRRFLKGASLQGAGDGKDTADAIKQGLNSRDPAEREMANRAMRAAIDDGQRTSWENRDKAAWLMHDAKRLTPDDIPRLEALGPSSGGAKAALGQMAKDGVDQLHQLAAGKDGNKDAQQALIALGSGSQDAAEKLKAAGVRLPVGAAKLPAQGAAEKLFTAGQADDVTQRALARVVLGSEKPSDAAATRAASAVQGDANKGDAKTLEALDAAQKNPELGQGARAASVQALGKAAAEGVKPAVGMLSAVGQEPFVQGNDNRYRAAVSGLRDAGLAGTPGAWDALRDTALQAKGGLDPRAGLVNKALVDGALDGKRTTATESIKTLDEVYRGTKDPAAKGQALAAMGRAGYGLTEKKAADGKPQLDYADPRVTAVRDSLRGALGDKGSTEQAAREMRKVAPFLDAKDAQALADKMDPANGRGAMESMYTLSRALPNLGDAEKARIFQDLRDTKAISRLAPQMNEMDVAGLKALAAQDDPKRIVEHMDAVIQGSKDDRARASAAAGLVEPGRFQSLTAAQRSDVVDAIKKGGLSHEVGALRQTLGWSPVEHQEVVQASRDLLAAAGDGGERQKVIDANQDKFQKQWDYVSSENFRNRLQLEGDPKRVQDELHREFGKLGILNPEKAQEIKDQAKKLYGQLGADAAAKPFPVDAPAYDRTKVQTRDPILDGIKGAASELFVAFKDSPQAQRLVEIGAIANNLVDDLDKSTGLNKIPPGWNNKINQAMDAGLNATGATGSVPTRPLKANEIAELKKVFGNSLDYSKIDLAIGSNNMMTKDDRPVALAGSNGRTTIHYPRGGRFADPPPTWSLIHESLHAWQRQHGNARYMVDSVHDQVAKGQGEAYNWRRAVGQGLEWRKWGPEQQAQFIEAAHEAGALKDTNDPQWVVEGQDLGPLLKDVLRQIRAGQGAP